MSFTKRTESRGSTLDRIADEIGDLSLEIDILEVQKRAGRDVAEDELAQRRVRLAELESAFNAAH